MISIYVDGKIRANGEHIASYTPLLPSTTQVTNETRHLNTEASFLPPNNIIQFQEAANVSRNDLCHLLVDSTLAKNPERPKKLLMIL